MIKTEQLYYLNEIEKYNSINKAAEKLYMAPSTLSTSIKKLETECGCELMRRTYRGVQFTEKGKQAAAIARQIIGLCNELENLADTKIAVPEKYHLYIEPAVFRLLSKKILHTKFIESFTCEEYSYPDDFSILKLMAPGSYGITIWNDEELKACDSDITYKILYESKVYPVSCKNTKHVKPKQKAISPKEYVQLPKITIRLAEKYEKNIILCTESPEVFQDAILNDLGIGTITKFAEDVYVLNSRLFRLYEPLVNENRYIVAFGYTDEASKVLNLIEKILK